jgi:hypothetical protein
MHQHPEFPLSGSITILSFMSKRWPLKESAKLELVQSSMLVHGVIQLIIYEISTTVIEESSNKHIFKPSLPYIYIFENLRHQDLLK